jgi:hypothetical protein
LQTGVALSDQYCQTRKCTFTFIYIFELKAKDEEETTELSVARQYYAQYELKWKINNHERRQKTQTAAKVDMPLK